MRKAMSMALLLGFAVSAAAQTGPHGDHAPVSPYAGQEMRPIKSLSEEDIAELRRGGGWGLAKAAELNGMPGPAHLLELKDQTRLTAAQVGQIEAIFASMQASAIAEGDRLIAAEAALEAAFRDRTVTEATLLELLAAIEASRAALRYVHLVTHLRTPALLSPAQIARYRELRGYHGGFCDTVPAGHDPTMWRRHNGCP